MQPITSIALALAGDENKVRSAPTDCCGFAERSPYTFRRDRALRQIAAVSVATLLAFAATGVAAQNAAQNAIDRNLLLRQQQGQDLQNRLDDATRNAMPGVPAQPPAGAGGSLPPTQLQLPPAQLPPADVQSQQLYQSQQQRLLQQQIQNRSLPGPVQEQQNQIQLQQFQREDQAQRLQRDIQRNSNPPLPGRH
jgi:hypothetical protein